MARKVKNIQLSLDRLDDAFLFAEAIDDSLVIRLGFVWTQRSRDGVHPSSTIVKARRSKVGVLSPRNLGFIGFWTVHQPSVETRNRKPMRPNPIAPWELRVGHLRVYCEVSDDPAKVVAVRAIGTKVGNKVRIGDEWWELGKAAAGEGQ